MQQGVIAELFPEGKNHQYRSWFEIDNKKPAVAGFLFRGLLQHAHNGFDDVEKHYRQERTNG